MYSIAMSFTFFLFLNYIASFDTAAWTLSKGESLDGDGRGLRWKHEMNERISTLDSWDFLCFSAFIVFGEGL